MKNLLFLFCLLLSNTVHLFSQNNFDARNISWDFNVSSGYFFGGPCNKLDIFLNNSGYNWELKTKNYLPILLDINKTISRKIIVGFDFVFFEQDLMWEEYGWSNSNFKVTILNPYMSYNLKNVIFINAGPTINHVSFFHPTGTSLEDDESHLKAGFIFKNTIKFPPKTRLYLQFDVLYSYGGAISPEYHIENITHQYTYVTLKAKNLPLNYFYVGTGLGIRLFRKTSPLKDQD
jgi:hypothetical protein